MFASMCMHLTCLCVCVSGSLSLFRLSPALCVSLFRSRCSTIALSLTQSLSLSPSPILSHPPTKTTTDAHTQFSRNCAHARAPSQRSHVRPLCLHPFPSLVRAFSLPLLSQAVSLPPYFYLYLVHTRAHSLSLSHSLFLRLSHSVSHPLSLYIAL